jgi:aromatic-L-amino-acid/L-tryptophan decarboxylase
VVREDPRLRGQLPHSTASGTECLPVESLAIMIDAHQNDTLQLSRDAMLMLGHEIVAMIVDHMESVCTKPVVRKMSRSSLERRLREPLPERGVGVGTVIGQLQQDVFSNIMHNDHPRCFSFIPGPSNFVSVMADALASGFNVIAADWLDASGPSEVELVTVDWLRQLCGLPQSAGGLFVSGGSMANLISLRTARYVMLRERIAGAIVYCSDQTHSSVERALQVLGFESTQLRKLPADDTFRLSVARLKQEVAADRSAGRVPFCVIANAGATNTGAVDPLIETAEVCKKERMWLHVDGAYGAPAVLCEKGRALLQGLELADSLSLDPHKWLFQPFEIGCALVRDVHLLKEAFAIRPEYLKDLESTGGEINFCDYGIQLSRSFRALKLWMSLKVFGLEAFREAVARGFALAEFAETLLRASPHWEIVTAASMGIVTFRFVHEKASLQDVDEINRRIVDEIFKEGFATVSSTSLRGRKVLRLCTINPRTTEDDLRQTIYRLARFGRLACV